MATTDLNLTDFLDLFNFFRPKVITIKSSGISQVIPAGSQFVDIDHGFSW